MPSNFNSMQANLGLLPQVPSPAETAATLSMQASQQLQQAAQTVSVPYGSTAPIAAFGQQFQQQLSQIQQQQSLGMHQAQALANLYPGAQQYPQHSLPSPLTMTPPSTGVFRPPMAPVSASPIPPMATQPMFAGPYTPRLPQPMFQSPWEQNIIQQDLQANQAFAYASQAPRVLGQGAGYGIGAMLGAGLGARFGGMGRIAGAIGGAALSHFSGAAQGLGNMAMLPMQPAMDRHMEAAALGRFSQDWVTTGPQVHALGMGLSRDASLQLASGIRNMAADSGFQRETGGMFNRADLMKITQVAGQSGLMDQSQDVDAIQKNLRQVAGTVRRFMELTNDPDVVSVIREMGRMRQFGFEVPEMERAAMNMRMFARAAGTTVQELKQTGGMAGAMTFQQAGLSPASGYQYGMYAQGAARQSVATGTYSPMQLSMLGGVQGIAQRDMQAQAAMMSMPLFGASISGFQGGGWGVNHQALAAQLSGQGGAAGMVTGALGNMNQAIQQGGIGALAMFPIQQRFVQAQAAQHVSPQEQMLMRFNMAQNTGARMGLGGQGGFALGAQMLFGQDVAEQMFMQAANPRFWEEQQATIRRQQDELAYQQRQEIKRNDPGWLSRKWEQFGFSGAGSGIADAFGGVGRVFESGAGAIGGVVSGIGDYITRARKEREGIYVGRKIPGSGISSRRELDALIASNTGGEFDAVSGGLAKAGGQAGRGQISAELYSRYMDVTDGGVTSTARDVGSFLAPFALGGWGGVAFAAGDISTSGAISDLVSGGIGELQGQLGLMTGDKEGVQDTISTAQGTLRRRADTFQLVSGAAKSPSATDVSGSKIDKATGKKGINYRIRNRVARKVARIAKLKRAAGESFDPQELRKFAETEMMAQLKAEKVDVDQLLKSVSSEDLRSVLGSGMDAAIKQDPALAGDWQKMSADDAKTRAMAADEYSAMSAEGLTKAIAGLDESLGIEAGWFNALGLSEEQQSAIDKMGASTSTGVEFATRVAIAGGILDETTQAQLRKEFDALPEGHKLKKKYTSFDEMAYRFRQTATTATSESFRTGVAELFKDEDLTAEQKREKLAGLGQRRVLKGAVNKREQMRKGLRGFKDALPEGWVDNYIGSLQGREITGAGLVEQIDEDTLAQMEKSGAGSIAKLVKAAQGMEAGSKKRKAIERSIENRILSKSASVSDEQQLTEATGEKAEELKRASAKLMDAQVKFAEVFKSFDTESLSNFKEGSKKLAEAMAEWEVNAPWGTKGG